MTDLQLGYRFGAFELDPVRFQLSRAGTPVPVEPQTLSVIQYLLENRHRLVTRDDLITAVWQGRVVSDWAVSAAIKSARQVLDDGQTPRRYIDTVHGKGFRFVAQVDLPATQRENAEASLIVVPFEMLSGDPADAYFADGFSEDVITELSQVAGLDTASRNASFSLRGQRPDDAVLHQTHGVTRSLQGSIRRMDGALRVNAQLRDVANGTQIWAQRFDGLGDGSFAVQDDIIARLVQSLQLELDPNRTKRRAPDPRAYDLCLRGRREYYQYTPRHLASALDYFRQAAAIDPEYGEVLAFQSYCQTSIYVFAMPGADTTLGPSRALAERAVALDPDSAIAQSRLGWVLGFLGDTDLTVAAFDQAIALDPANSDVLHAYGETMNRLGQPERALVLLDRAMRIERFAPPSWDWARGHSQLLLGDFEAAQEHILPVLDKIPGFVPALVQLARGYVESGDIGRATETVAKIRKAAPNYRMLNAKRMFPYPQRTERDRLVSALTQAGLPET